MSWIDKIVSMPPTRKGRIILTFIHHEDRQIHKTQTDNRRSHRYRQTDRLTD